MKKFATFTLIIIALSLLTACGENGGGNSNTPGDTSTNRGKTVQSPAQTTEEIDGLMNPPAWMIGEWVRADGNAGEGISVTEKNVVVSSGKLNFTWQKKNTGLEIKETTDGNHYRLEYTQQEILFSYDFTLQEDGRMILRLFDAPLKIIYTKK